METIRSFISFDIEEGTVLTNILKVQEMLVETGASLKLVKPENIHITLRFLGNITPAMVDEIYREMNEVDFTPFQVEIKGVGVFPNLRRISVIWAGIHEGADKLENIFGQLEPKLRKLGVRRDTKGFSPHLTIARVKTGRNKDQLVKRLTELEDYKFGVVKAECLRLKKSVLTPQGPVYSILREVCRKP